MQNLFTWSKLYDFPPALKWYERWQDVRQFFRLNEQIPKYSEGANFTPQLHVQDYTASQLSDAKIQIYIKYNIIQQSHISF